ncbi:t-SNARE [Vararia minispora EC-137]|uniref:t-SNARE n=1 Tax=Vararia minispora EC-137 TaxID=1314806 RepID=A0ACB8QVL4_9AGAM|nr:t-SNARE [Vararia minispora EC-137]
MARDRLAAMRAQQQGGSAYTGNSSYPSSNEYGGGGGGYGGGGGGYQGRRAPNPYAQQDSSAYEMADYQNSRTNLAGSAPAPAGAPTNDMSAFYDEISSIQDNIKRFNANVQQISDLHSRSLNNTDEQAAQRVERQLEELVNETSALSNVLKRTIKSLERQGGAGRDGQIRKQQTGLVKSKFVEAIQSYQQVEQQYRQRYKQRLERQYKIVSPNATPDEVRAVVNDENGGQVFSQALMNSNRYGEARSAYREVQERHEDIKRIERTIAELAQLFNDMSILVEQQDETITAIEATAGEVEKDVETGLGYTEKAVTSARAARKKRWICFTIAIILIIIIIIVILVALHPWRK